METSQKVPSADQEAKARSAGLGLSMHASLTLSGPFGPPAFPLPTPPPRPEQLWYSEHGFLQARAGHRDKLCGTEVKGNGGFLR